MAQAIARSQAQAARATVTALAELMPAAGGPENCRRVCRIHQRTAGSAGYFFSIRYANAATPASRARTEGFKPVLAFDYDMIVDGRKLDRPVNYALVRIHPPAGTMPPREDGRPWVIIDPRAGHGSGIGGFKSESEVGVALRGRPSGLFRHIFPRARAGTDAGGRVRGRSGVPARGPCAPSAQPETAHHRQLPGRLGDDDPCRHPSRSDGADRDRRRAAVLLVGRKRPQSVPLFRRRRRRRRARAAGVGFRRRQVRRRQSGA